VRDTPISESSFVGVGIGAAMAGMRPVVELLFMDFALVAADQIVGVTTHSFEGHGVGIGGDGGPALPQGGGLPARSSPVQVTPRAPGFVM